MTGSLATVGCARRLSLHGGRVDSPHLLIGGEVVSYDQVVSVDAEPADNWLELVPMEALALRIAGLRRHRTTMLSGLIGVRWPSGN
jgi:hypothetical protein